MPPRSRFLHVCAAAVLLAATAGCTKKALQGPDGGGGGILPLPDAGRDAIATDAGGGGGNIGQDGGGALDAAWDVTFGGRESFVVTSEVTTDSGPPVSHTFTMTVDSRQQIAIIGSPGSGTIVPVEQVPGGLRVRFDYTSFAFGIPAVAVCGATVTYSDAVIVIDPGLHLSGTGRGERTTYDPSGTKSVPATAVLTGVLDTEGPTLSLTAGGDLGDPWTPLWVVASEPLPTTQRAPVLRSAGGDIMAFEPQPSGGGAFISVLARPTRMLRFNDQYYVTFDGVTDLMGNAPTSATSQTFTTRPLPPLVAADGFESVSEATLDGARILSGAGAPTITGARSLYLPPAESLGSASTVTQFALRVPIAVGNTVLRFSYRTVNPGDTSNVYYVVGSVGGPIGTASLPSDVAGPTTQATIDQIPVTLGPVQTAAIGLPGSTYIEVVFARLASQPMACGGPAPRPVPGVIIDDLHAE